MAWTRSWPWASLALCNWGAGRWVGRAYNLVPLPHPDQVFQGPQWDAQERAKNSEFTQSGATWEGALTMQIEPHPVGEMPALTMHGFPSTVLCLRLGLWGG